MSQVDSEDKRYDPVVDALTEKREKLWKMTQQNMNAGAFNIMDQIRLDHVDQLDKAIQCWNKYKHEWIDDETE